MANTMNDPASTTATADDLPRVTPPPRPLPLLQYLARFVVNPLSALPEQVYEQPYVRYGGRRTIVVWVTDPELVGNILLRNSAQFPKTPLERQVLGPMLGNGILTSEGQDWRWQRKTVAPMFRHSELLGYIPAMTAAAEVQLARWRARGPAFTTEVGRDMTEMTLAVIMTTVLAGCNAAEAKILMHSNDRFLAPIPWALAYGMMRFPSWLWHPGKRRMLDAATDQRAAVRRLVRLRRTDTAARDDIVARLMSARHPDTGAPMPEELLVDNLATFLAAGHETTAKALTWTLYVLARLPAWQERIRAEVADVAGSADLTTEMIAKLSLTQRVLKEAMRLYPPAPVMTRIASEGLDLGGTRIAPGTLIVIPVYAIHRHKKLWPEPDRFDPDRFLPEREAKHQRAQYMPFGFGSRTCIGSAFAMIEATALLGTLVRGARFVWDGAHRPEPISRVTLRPKGGMPLGVEVIG